MGPVAGLKTRDRRRGAAAGRGGSMVGWNQGFGMTNGDERMDRIEGILEQVANSLREVAARQHYHDEAFERHDAQMKAIRETIRALAHVTEQSANSIREVAARQQYHDEAFERHDAEMKAIREAISVDAENIRALARIAELHHRRLTELEGGEVSEPDVG